VLESSKKAVFVVDVDPNAEDGKAFETERF